MTQTLSREQIEWSRKILAALTEDAVMKPGGTFGLKQPEWKNRVDLIIDMALASQRHGLRGLAEHCATERERTENSLENVCRFRALHQPGLSGSPVGGR